MLHIYCYISCFSSQMRPVAIEKLYYRCWRIEDWTWFTGNVIYFKWIILFKFWGHSFLVSVNYFFLKSAGELRIIILFQQTSKVYADFMILYNCVLLFIQTPDGKFVQGFNTLRLLNLEDNNIDSWDEIVKLSYLKR